MGIINAAAVNTKVAAGDYAGAQVSSAAAGKWTKIGFFVALAGFILYGVALALGLGTALMQGLTNGR